ncbi:MAG: GAF domain-containing protein [Chloroflexota bacterium]
MIDNGINEKVRQLKSQVAALEQLLLTKNQTVLPQADKLEQALGLLQQVWAETGSELEPATSTEVLGESSESIWGDDPTLLRSLIDSIARLETVVEVSTAVSTILEADRLLQAVVDLTKERFGLYHAHIYLLNEFGDTLELAAGAGEVGRQLVAEGWHIPVEQGQSLVARAARIGEVVIANNVHQEPDWLPNSLLPETRSEMAVPMMIGGLVLGILDVQAAAFDHFTAEDARVQLALAAQIAVALENASQHERTRTALAEVQQSQTLLQAIIDATPDWIFVKDRQHRYRQVNRSYAASLHLQPSDFIGKNDLELGFPEEIVKGDPATGIRGFWADDQEVIESGETKFIEGETAEVDGEPVYLSTRKIPLLDSAGEVWGVLDFVQDISERMRTAKALAKQAGELKTVVEVSTAVSTIREVNRLLQAVVDLTKEQFHLYHTHIYVLDEMGATLDLAAGAGEVGRQMVAEGWRIPLSREQSLVARAARTGQGVIVNDVRENPGWLPNPLLPDTRSELAVPMLMGERVLGVLDLQSAEINRFSDEDARIQTALAAQIAVALENARLFAGREQASLMLEKRVKELDCLNDIGQEMELAPAVPALLQWVTERIPPAMRYPELALAAIEYDNKVYGFPTAISLPVQMTHGLYVGGEILGKVYIAYTERQDFLDEESALLGAIATRLSGYIENRRLFNQLQVRAQREQILRQVTDRIRSSVDAETIMRTAAREVGQVLGRPAFIYLGDRESHKKPAADDQQKDRLG